MEDLVIDDQKTENKIPLLLTTGLFTFSLISVFGLLTKILAKDFLILNNFTKVISFGFPEVVRILIISVLAFFLSKKIKSEALNNSQKLKSLLKKIIFIFAVIQIIQFSYSFFRLEIWGDDFVEKLQEYYLSGSEMLFYGSSSAFLDFLEYAIIGYFFIKKE